MDMNGIMFEADLLAKNKKFQEAEDLYQKLLQDTNLSNGEQALVKNNIGQLKYLRVLFDEAIVQYDEAIKLDPSLPVAYYNRGTIYYRMGDFAKALVDFEKATSLKDCSEEFQLGKTRCLEQLQNPKSV